MWAVFSKGLACLEKLLVHFLEVLQVDYEGYVELAVEVDLSDRLTKPIVLQGLALMLVIKVKVCWHAQQIFTWNDLRHATIIELYFGGPDVLPVVYYDEESVITASKRI